MPSIYFRHTRTGKRFQVLKMDKEAGEVTLKGEISEFTEKYDKDKFVSMGYVLEKGD